MILVMVPLPFFNRKLSAAFQNQSKARTFLLVYLQTLLMQFSKKLKKISKIVLLFNPPALNIICVVEKSTIFLRFCLCIFESDTVKSDCPVHIVWEKDKIFKDLIQKVGLLY